MAASLAHVEGLSECIGRAIQEHLEGSNINLAWPQIETLVRPILRVEAFLEDAGPENASSQKVASRTVELGAIVTPGPSRSPTFPQEDFHASKSDTSAEEEEEPFDDSRRKGTGGLRMSHRQSIQEDTSEHQRHMQVDTRSFPKRKKIISDKFVFQPSTLDKLLIGIMESIHGSIGLDPKAIFERFQIDSEFVASATSRIPETDLPTVEDVLNTVADPTYDSFTRMNVFCLKVTQVSRASRSIEMLVQARWVELFEEQVQIRMAAMPDISFAKHKKAVLIGACQDFGWTEKELRNKTAIWRGYREVKDAAGWAALVFAGQGIYRFCKYRVDFDANALKRLRNMRKRIEVAADTLHPHWRELLAVVGESPTLRYPGHPHEWVVFEDGAEPLALRQTYQQHDPYFTFDHIDESIIDEAAWGCDDPRWMPAAPSTVARTAGAYICGACGEPQSDNAKDNLCFCFPTLFGCVKRKATPVQIFRTPDGKNNGLLALVPFPRGAAIGELVGLVTKGVRHLDVMDASTPLANYQIWQGRMGNYTRFANHSCKANAQSSTFTWLDTQHVVFVSKGIPMGAEITLDYGDKYWDGLDKQCLCGEACCRYRREPNMKSLL